MLIEVAVGIWALVRQEQINYRTLSFAQHEEIIALAIMDEKPIWDHMQSKVKVAFFFQVLQVYSSFEIKIIRKSVQLLFV